MGLLFPNIPKNLIISGAVPQEPALSGYPKTSYIALYGRMTYDDVFGHHHSVNFCSVRPLPETTDPHDARARCIEYNER